MSSEKRYTDNPVAKWVADIAIPEHKQIVQRIQQQFKIYNLRDWVKTVDGRLDKELAITLIYTVLNTSISELAEIVNGRSDICFVPNELGFTWLDKIVSGYVTDISADPEYSEAIVCYSLAHLNGKLQPFRLSEDIKQAKEYLASPLGKISTEDLIKELKQRLCKGVDSDRLELNFTYRVDLEK